MKFSTVVFILSAISAAAYAADPGDLTLDGAIDKGVAYSPTLKKAESQVRQSSSMVGQAKSAIFPTLTATGTGEELHNALSIVNGNVATTTSNNGENYQVALNLNQPIYSGGLLTGGLDAAKTAQDLAQQAYYSAKQTLITAIVTAFLKQDSAQASLAAAQANLKVTADFEDVARHYQHIGRSRKLDLLQAAANVSLSRADVESSASALRNANADLAVLLGDPAGTVYHTRFKVNLYKMQAFDMDHALSEALKNNPDVRQTVLATESVGYARQVAFATDMPNLSLVATAGYTAGDRPDLFNDDSRFYTVGLNLSVPIFSGLSSISKGHQYDEEKIQAQKSEDIERDTIRQNLHDSLETLQSAEAQVKFAREAVVQAREALELANQEYKIGTAANTDVYTAQTTRYATEKLLLSTEYAYLQALLTLRQTMGIDLEKVYANSES